MPVSSSPPSASAVSTAKDWFRPLARLGYAARGLIYLVIGFFAALAAIGSGEAMGSQEALRTLMGTTTGSILTWVLTIGLVSYALWRLIQAIFDTDDHGTGARGLAVRGGLVAAALTYGALALYTFSAARGAASSGDEGGGIAQTLAGFVGSRWAATIIGAVLIGVAFAHFYKALKERYAPHFAAGPDKMRFIHPIAKIGLIARGTVFGVAGFMLGLAAWRGNGDNDAPGSEDALQYIESLPGGIWLLAATGLGLIAFAAYSFLEAVYRRINVEEA